MRVKMAWEEIFSVPKPSLRAYRDYFYYENYQNDATSELKLRILAESKTRIMNLLYVQEVWTQYI